MGICVSIDQEQVGKLGERYSGKPFSLIKRFAGIGCVSFRDDSVDIRGKLEPRVTRSTELFQQSYQIKTRVNPIY
jgi:hypothetical protein